MHISQEQKGNVMTVKEFCEKYNVSAAAVYSKMRKNPEMFEDHLMRNEREQIADMDGEAIRNLLPLAANGDNIIELLDETFKKGKDYKGVAFTVGLSSVIGTLVYGFLSNDKRTVKETQ